MNDIPKKNISSRMSDVRTPDDRAQEPKEMPPVAEAKTVEEIFSSAQRPDPLHPLGVDTGGSYFRITKKIFAGIMLVFLLASSAVGLASWAGKKMLARFAAEGQNNIDEALNRMESLDFTSASNSLRAAKENFEGANSKLDLFAKMYKEINSIIPVAKNGVDTLKEFGAIADSSIQMATKLQDIAINASQYFDPKSGKDVLPVLEEIRGHVADIKAHSLALSRSSGDTRSVAPFASDAYLPITVNLDSAERALSRIIAWLKEDKEHVIITLLQNSSELRATGGFIGSFADVRLMHGKITSIAVHDINDADNTFAAKIIPPKPMQVISKRWFPSDANWNFDFAVSAARIADMMESSSLYSSSGTKIDGIVAVTPKVGEDILRLTGPVSLAGGKTLSADTYLQVIQEDVQKKQAEKNSEPKTSVSDSLSALMSAAASLSENKKQEFLPRIQEWAQSKDIMLYMRDTDIQKALDLASVSGRMMDLPANFNGDYFAVVVDTLQGGKSDAYMKRKVTLQSQLGLDGIVSNHVTLENTHAGNKAKSWWYKEENKGYVRIFTPAGATLEAAKGVWDRPQQAATYDTTSFSSDPYVANIESTKKEYLSLPGILSFTENNRNVFSAWQKVSPGETRTLSYDYSFRSYTIPHEGQKYQFVFEKQPGLNAKYAFDISAPVGYVWKESMLPVYEMESDELPGRLVIDLTLAKS